MIDVSLVLTHGLLMSLVFSVFVIGTLIWKPRLWLQDFPADLQAAIPPKTDAEKRQTMWIGFVFFAMLFGGLILVALQYQGSNQIIGMFIHVYLVWQIVNMVDLIIIDWCGMQLVDPDNPPFPGTEGAKGYRDYRFHFVGFIKGSIMGLVLSAIVSGIALLLGAG